MKILRLLKDQKSFNSATIILHVLGVELSYWDTVLYLSFFIVLFTMRTQILLRNKYTLRITTFSQFDSSIFFN